MATIETVSNIEDGKTIVNLVLSKSELTRLKGNLNEIILFSEHNLEHESRLIKRGVNESTKYFLLPRRLRENIVASTNVSCSKIETENSNIFIFSIPKTRTYH